MSPTLGVPRNAGQIHGRSIDSGIPLNGQVLIWDDSSKTWKLGSISVFGSWVDSSITPTWIGGTPDITSAVTKHVRNGNVVTFDMTYIISDGHDAILESLTLPVAATQVAGRSVPLISFKQYTDGEGDSTPSDPYAYIDYAEATPIIKFRISGGGYPADCSAILNISGSYEVEP